MFCDVFYLHQRGVHASDMFRFGWDRLPIRICITLRSFTLESLTLRTFILEALTIRTFTYRTPTFRSFTYETLTLRTFTLETETDFPKIISSGLLTTSQRYAAREALPFPFQSFREAVVARQR